MKLLGFLLVVASFVSRVAVARPEVQCDVLEDFDVVRRFGRFSISLPTRDLHGRKYECTCATSACSKVYCAFLDVVIETVDISSKVSAAAYHSSRGLDDCYDEMLQMRVSRGETYTRPATPPPMMGCVCPVEGSNNIVCEPLTCRYDIGPKDLLTPPKKAGHCTNPWTQQTHARNERFNHTMIVNKYQKMTNTLQCSCDNGMVACKLTEHLCCDEKTGELKHIGESFHKSHPQHRYVMCVCAPVEMTCKTIPKPTLPPWGIPQPPSTNPRSSRNGCLDKVSNQYVARNAQFAHVQEDGSVRECRCKLRKRRKKQKNKKKQKSVLRCKIK